jgi:26S proteasome regulatory subunit N5
MEVDYSATVEVAIPQAKEIAKSGNMERAIETLLALEKQTRTGGDAMSTAKILVCIIDMCYEANNYKALKENLLLLNKRRAQLKVAIKRMVQRCMEILDSLPYDQKMDLLNTLITVTEGKIFVEKQRARLTRILAKIREDEGQVSEAANILQEVQVETFGSMKKQEKTDYILEQMRLCLRKKDYIRTQIISRKIMPKLLENPDFSDLKIRYYTLMVEYYAHSHQYLDIYKCYQAIYSTPAIQNDPEQWKKYLKLCTAYILLAPYSNEENDLINKLSLEKNMNSIPSFKEMIKTFLTKEIINWTEFQNSIKSDFSSLAPFAAPSSSIPGVVSPVDKLWADLRDRTTEHNIRVIASYYSQLSLSRLAELLDQTTEEAEKHLADQVTSRFIWARIDRANGVINFIKPQTSNEVLNDWSADVSSLLGLVEKVCHLIQRENMVHAVRKSQHGKMDVSN